MERGAQLSHFNVPVLSTVMMKRSIDKSFEKVQRFGLPRLEMHWSEIDNAELYGDWFLKRMREKSND